jgi:PAS domain S-box-containing protein
LDKNTQVLVVEAEKSVRDLTVDLLRKAGYSTLQAASGKQALLVIEESRPDLVLLGIDLPDISAQDLFRDILDKHHEDVSVILIIGEKSGIDNQLEGLKIDPDDSIVRPVSNKVFLARVKTVLRLRMAEKALRENELRFRSIYEKLPLGYQSLDKDGKFLDVNQVWLTTLGYERNEVIGKWFGDFPTIGQKELFKERFPVFKAKGGVKGAEFEMVRKDGSHIFVSFDGKIEHDSLGQFKQTHCILTDVTDKKKSENALRESEQKFRLLVENAGVGVGYFDLEGNVRYFNDKALQNMAGCSEDFLGKNVVELFGREFGEGIIQRIKLVSQTNTPSFFDDQVEMPKGKRWYHSTYNRILDAVGNLAGVQIISDDVTDQKLAEEKLKASEEKFRMVFDNSNVGKSLTLPTGEIRSNKAMANMLGYSQEELNTKSWQMVTPPEDIPMVQAKLEPILKGEANSVRFNKRYIHKDGSILWGDVSTTIRRDDAGNPLHFITTVVDITERKQAEEALWDVQHQLHNLMNNLPGMAYRAKADESWTMTFVSDFCLRLTGYHPYDLVNNKKISYEELIHPEDLNMVKESTSTARDGKFQLAYRIITAEGQTKWVWEQGQRFVNEENGETYYEGFITDISNQKTAEDAMQQSYNLLALFVKHSPVYAYVKEVNETKSRVVFASENFIDMIGIPGSKMAGKSMEELFPPEFALKMSADDWAVISKGENLTLEEELNGRNYISIKYPIQFGTKNLLAGYTVDITELKQTELTLRQVTARQNAILGSIPDILMEADINKVYTWANQTGVEFFGEDVVGHEAQEFFIGEQETYAKVQALFRGDEQTIYVESWQRRHDGEKRLLAWWCRVLKDIDGNPIGSLSTARDITEERLAQEEIIDLNTRLEQRVEERTRELREAQEQIVRQEKLALLGQLAGGVGHELRNPLGVISNAVYFLKMINPDSDEKVKKYLGMIETETKNAEKIISDLLEFARTKSVEREKTNLSDLINRSLARRPTPMNIEVTMSLPESLPMVLVDPRHIEQILENLVVNAYQAMPEGGELKISAKSVLRDKKSFICVHVKDSGMGISSENMSKIFEPLFTTKPKGIGLGLAVCRKLAEINEGSIDVKSEPGNGADFILDLPAAGDK